MSLLTCEKTIYRVAFLHFSSDQSFKHVNMNSLFIELPETVDLVDRENIRSTLI